MVPAAPSPCLYCGRACRCTAYVSGTFRYTIDPLTTSLGDPFRRPSLHANPWGDIPRAPEVIDTTTPRAHAMGHRYFQVPLAIRAEAREERQDDERPERRTHWLRWVNGARRPRRPRRRRIRAWEGASA